MKLICIDNATMEQINRILPHAQFFWLDLCEKVVKDKLIFAYMDGESVVCMAIYETFCGTEKLAVCLYVRTMKAYRRKGYATQILRESVKDLEARGYTHITVATAEESNEVTVKFLTSCGLTKHDVDYNIGYYVGKLKEAGITSKLADCASFGNIKKIDEISDFVIGKFERNVLSGYGVRLRDFNSKLSRYFVVDNEIMGFLLADTKDNEVFYSVETIVMPSKKTQMALPLMFFSLVDEIIRVASEQAGVILGFREEKHVQAMEKYFGKPEGISQIVYWWWKPQK